MKDMPHPKFIIENGDLIIGKVDFHHQLVTDKKLVTGGGWFKIIKEYNQMIFYGESHDFGAADCEAIKTCVEQQKVFDRNIHRNICHRFTFGYENGSMTTYFPPCPPLRKF